MFKLIFVIGEFMTYLSITVVIISSSLCMDRKEGDAF